MGKFNDSHECKKVRLLILLLRISIAFDVVVLIKSGVFPLICMESFGMRMKLIASVAAGLIVTGCGNDGGSGQTAAPPATPSPPSTPTPTTSGENKPTADAIAVAVSLELTKTATSTTSRETASDIAFQLSYAAGTATYTLTDVARTRSFSPAQLVEETSVPDLMPHVSYQISGTNVDYLLIAKAPNASPPVAVRYGAYGAWQQNTAMAGATRIRLDYFTYCSPTPAGQMPRTGTARFRLVGTGNYATDNGLFLTQSDTTFDVDFAAGTVFGVPTLSGTDFLTGSYGGLIGFRVRASIAGNSAAGDIDSDIATVSGRYKLLFCGPNADEMAIVISGGNDQARWATAGIGVRI